MLGPLREFGSPLADNMERMAYTALQSAPDAGFPPGRRHYWKSSYLKELSQTLRNTKSGSELRFRARRRPISENPHLERCSYPFRAVSLGSPRAKPLINDTNPGEQRRTTTTLSI